MKSSLIVPVAASAAAAAFATVSWYVTSGDVRDYVLIAGIGLAASVPLLVRFLRDTFDIFEPVVAASFAFLLLWVARPLYNLVGDYSYLRLPLSSEYPTALLAAFISVCAFQIAYHTPVPRRIASALPAFDPDPSRRVLLVAGSLLTVAAAVAVAVIAHLKGGWDQLFVRRGVAQVEIAPYIRESFLVALPAALLFLAVPGGGRARAIRLLAIAPLALIGVMAIPGGDRRYLLPAVGALVVFWFLRAHRRPPVLLVLALAVVLLVFVIDPLRSVRTGAESYPTALSRTLDHPAAPATSLLRSGDTAMLETVSMETAVMGKLRIRLPTLVPPRLRHLTKLNEPIPFRHGVEALSDTVLAPIPRQLWRGKPWKTQTLLIDHYFGTTASGGCVTQCPAFAFVGEAYADFGFWSVAALSALFGVGLATGYAFFRRHEDVPLAQAAYAAGLWLALQPWEAGMSIIMHSFLITVGPILLLGWLVDGD